MAAWVCALGPGTAGCTSDDSFPSANPFTDASLGGTVGYDPSGSSITPIGGDGGVALKAWPPSGVTCQATSPCPPDPGPNAVYVTISGESNALTGYPFPPNLGTDSTYMVDGWSIHIDEYIVNVDNIVLWSNPDANPSNQGSLQGMIQVAHLSGPFVVDLHKGGRIIGQGGAPEEATPIGVIANQNDNGFRPFDSTTAYGFGFSTVAATYDAYNVNLDSSEAADFDYMVQSGYSVLYVGTATWAGGSSPYTCTQTQAGAGPNAGQIDGAEAGAVATYVDGGYDFSRLPSRMAFRLGFSTPTNYVNCQNMTLQGTPNANEDYPRGVQTSSSDSVIAQVTLHMDHPFWESFAEGSPIHWDQIAGQYIGVETPTAAVDDMKGIPFYAFTDSTGTPLPWRNCVGSNYYASPTNGQMSFSTLSVPINPQGTCTGEIGVDFSKDNCPAIRDYFDYIRFTQSTQGHLNSQGQCFIDRHYPAPAGGS